MALQRSLRSWTGIVIFIVLVALSGIALSASGNMRNPFQVIPDIVNFVQNGGQERGGERGEGFPQATGTGGAQTGGRGALQTTPGAGSTGRRPPANFTPSSGGTQPEFGGNRSQFQGEGAGRGRGNEEDIQWNQIGSVLFNLWFFAACTAVVLLIGRFLSYLSGRFFKRGKPGKPQQAASLS